MNHKCIRFYIRCACLLGLVVLLLQSYGFNSLQTSDVSLKEPLAKSSKPSYIYRNQNQNNLNIDVNVPKWDFFSANRPKIIQKIQIRHNMQTVLNEKKYGPLENYYVVIVIQVHRKFKYLKNLIRSLSQAKGISKALLVFSHHKYDDDINDYVQGIEFCKVIQIFYPYSIQAHPYKFPGRDPNDCPWNISKDLAITKKCNNALYPDVHGYYRDAERAQYKHFWWWTANFVFQELQVTKNHTGLMLFLEENHYVAEDFLYMLKLMQANPQELCPECNILCLSNELKSFKFAKVECSPWLSEKHSIAIAFNRTTWSSIRGCGREFCTHDDYNWNLSLDHISKNCLKQKLFVMTVKTPRVIAIGQCKMYDTNMNCKNRQGIFVAKRAMTYSFKYDELYPPSLKVIRPFWKNTSKTYKMNWKYGGWSDPRDHQLCLKIARIS